ncbi:putative selenate ABC transporter substrate-binding protein [Prochlorococcus sp. MIT 1223]|uniref:putative selenate ABC transporter substrate-binding protein n=1 Tax=Prochlorococcus sp. MIT 1223 TaxID=3096217 RepID=UPI0039C0E868
MRISTRLIPDKNAVIIVFLTIINLCIVDNMTFAQNSLVIGAIPDQNPEKLNRLYRLLSSELSASLQVPVIYKPVINYPAAVTAFRTGDLDLVWFGGLTGVQARLQTKDAKVIAQRDIDAEFHSVFIANKKSKLPKIKDISGLKLLAGKRFTFGSESSTSGRLMPQHYLQKAGISIKDFKGGRPGFSGSHDATVALVQSGSYEAGVLNEQVWLANIEKNRIDLSKVNIIWRTPSYVDYHWLAQGDLDKRFRKGFTKELKTTLLSFNKKSKRQKRILNLFGANKFISADADQYKDIEKIGRQLGKIK